MLDDFGAFGRAYRETDPRQADRQTVLADLLSGQYERPLRIVAFNTAEGWARDVTAEIAHGRLWRCAERSGTDDLRAGLVTPVERTGMNGPVRKLRALRHLHPQIDRA